MGNTRRASASGSAAVRTPVGPARAEAPSGIRRGMGDVGRDRQAEAANTIRPLDAAAGNACGKGVKVIAREGGIEEPCAGNAHVARPEPAGPTRTRTSGRTDGLWMQVGRHPAASMQSGAGIPDDRLIPCAGKASDGHRIQANGACRPLGPRPGAALSHVPPPAAHVPKRTRRVRFRKRRTG